MPRDRHFHTLLEIYMRVEKVLSIHKFTNTLTVRCSDGSTQEVRLSARFILEIINALYDRGGFIEIPKSRTEIGSSFW